jgi:hypothetical protein
MLMNGRLVIFISKFNLFKARGINGNCPMPGVISGIFLAFLFKFRQNTNEKRRHNLVHDFQNGLAWFHFSDNQRIGHIRRISTWIWIGRIRMLIFVSIGYLYLLAFGGIIRGCVPRNWQPSASWEDAQGLTSDTRELPSSASLHSSVLIYISYPIVTASTYPAQ